VAGFPPRRHCFEPRPGHMGFLVDKVALRQVSSEYFGFPCHFSFHRLLHTHHLSSAGGTISKTVADVPSGLSLTPPQKSKKNIHSIRVSTHVASMHTHNPTIYITHSPSQYNFCYVSFFSLHVSATIGHLRVFGSERFHTALIRIPCCIENLVILYKILQYKVVVI
jgi:hypothetical protein